MKSKEFYPIIISFIWFGLIAAISFLEAPIKFTAPSLTLPVGLDVGMHVFAALNKVEISFALLTIFFLILNKPPLKIKITFSVVFLILVLQTAWLLPALEERALVYINGKIPPASSIHIVYIVLEVIKLVLLFTGGILQIGFFKDKVLENEIIFTGKNLKMKEDAYETA